MTSREELEERVDRLEKELAAARGYGGRAVRRRATWGIGNLPFWEVAVGPDPGRGEMRGHAKAIDGAQFSPMGDHLLTQSQDRTSRLWTLDGAEVAVLPGKAEFAPSGERLLVGHVGASWLVVPSQKTAS